MQNGNPGHLGGVYPGNMPQFIRRTHQSNATVDLSQYEDSKTKTPGTAFLNGPVTDSIQTIFPQDICVYWAKNGTFFASNNSMDRSGALTVFAALNGIGKQGQSKWAILEQMRSAGFALTPTAEDKTNYNREVSLVVLKGGQMTLNNMGPEPIFGGDSLYFDIAESDAEAQAIMARTRNVMQVPERITAFLRPYNPLNQRLHTRLIREVTFQGKVPRTPLEQGCRKTVDAITQIGYLFILADRAGLFPTTARGSIGGIAGITKPTALQGLKNELSKPDTLLLAQALSMATRDPLAWQRPFDRKKYMLELLIPFSGADNIAPFDGVGQPPKGQVPFLVHQIQQNVITSLLVALESVTWYTKRRIVATAESNAAPGQPFDADIGHYSS